MVVHDGGWEPYFALVLVLLSVSGILAIFGLPGVGARLLQVFPLPIAITDPRFHLLAARGTSLARLILGVALVPFSGAKLVFKAPKLKFPETVVDTLTFLAGVQPCHT